MKKVDFMLALEILSENHTTKITINQPIDNFVGDLGTKHWTIHINRCVPAVTTKLIEAGFVLGMTEYGLEVNKY